MSEEVQGDVICPMCHQSEHVRRLLFYTYCANPAHTHKKGEAPTNTVLEFRWCVVHGRPDTCVPVVTG
ncbi:MAG TPA: hypothetical protein VGO93_04635 [Candidatus Xenobia bacterium]|jgi:hypothetical protein